MNGNNFESQEEFKKFLSCIELVDIVLTESSSKVLSIVGRSENDLETSITLADPDITIVSSHENSKNFLVSCFLSAEFEIKKNQEKYLSIFAKIQAVYKVTNYDANNYERIVKTFVTDSAYTHIISFLRVYIMDMINKSGYPRYVVPLFKQLSESEFVEKKNSDIESK